MEQDYFELQLASKSPRRREILDQIGVSYKVVPVTIDESAKINESPNKLVTRLAQEKARTGFDASPVAATLGSDTIVVFEGEVFGKPKDANDSYRMLSLLSGAEHQVLSAVSLYDGKVQSSALSCSKVRFRNLGDDEIRRYWLTGEPQDKAGSYAIQGKGAVFVSSLQGTYSGVMGLPILETSQLLQQFNVCVWQK